MRTPNQHGVELYLVDHDHGVLEDRVQEAAQVDPPSGPEQVVCDQRERPRGRGVRVKSSFASSPPPLGRVRSFPVRERAPSDANERNQYAPPGQGRSRNSPLAAELLIDCEEDRTLRAVLVGMLREAER